MRSPELLLASCVALALASCAHGYERYDARVDAYLNPAYQLGRKDIFCLVPAAQAHPDGGLPKQRRYDELARICADAGQKKGVRIFAERIEGCLPTVLDWSVGGEGEASVSTESGHHLTSRLRSYGDIRKELRLVVKRPDADESLIEARAAMRSDLDAFTDDTAEVLCRAVLQDFPARVNNKVYTVVLPRK